jgi:hypothetical protein
MKNILGLLLTLLSLTLFGQSRQVPLTTEERLNELNIIEATSLALRCFIK